MSAKRGWKRLCGDTNVLHYYVSNTAVCGAIVTKKKEPKNSDFTVYCKRCIAAMKSALNKVNSL